MERGSSGVFKFAGFDLAHDKSSMKVGTDGILLGCWAQPGHARHILEVGTGSGVVSLILCSKNEGQFQIDAIDIDEPSVHQARENFSKSNWSKRLVAHQIDFLKWQKGNLDHIISNPPFFTHGPVSPDSPRAQARHQMTLTLDQLLAKSFDLLKKGGKLTLIIPYEHKSVLDHLPEQGWTITRVGYFRPYENKPFNRLLIECIKRTSEDFHTIFQVITQYKADGSWHADYLKLAGEVHHPSFLKT